MARWRLMVNHYLNVVTSQEWEYIAIQNGRQIRRRFTVPRYLDINDPNDWTIKPNGLPISMGGNLEDAAGAVVVCAPGRGAPGDIEFLGDPTPDMMPLDDEAREISAQFTTRWSYKPEDAEVSYSQVLVDKMDELRDAVAEAEPAPIRIEGLADLVSMLAENQKTIAALVSAQTRRV